MAPLDVIVGRAYVVNYGGNKLEQMGLKIALCVGRAKGGDVLLCGRQGALGKGRWFKFPKRCSATCVRREASEREVMINMPVGYVPGAGS